LQTKQHHSHNTFRSASNKELVQIFAHETPTIPDPFKEEDSLQGLLRFPRYARLLSEITPLKVSHSVPEFCHRFAQETLLFGIYRLKYASKLLQQLLVFPPFLTSQTARFSKDFPSKMMK